MTKEEALHMSEVLKAWADGKEIEIEVTKGEWTKLMISPNFSCSPYIYRIKAEPKLRPYASAEEFLEMQKKHGMYLKWIIGLEDDDAENECNMFMPQLVCNDGVRISITGTFYTWKDLLTGCTWQDGHHLGFYI